MEGDNPSHPEVAPTAVATVGASPKSRARLKTLLTNPWFGGIAALASIISIPLAFYLYISAQARPGLTIYVHPVRTPIVKAGQTSGLTVLFKGKETGPNITAVQIVIWNNGNTPIHKENILDDITLRLDPDYTILEASVRSDTERDGV